MFLKKLHLVDVSHYILMCKLHAHVVFYLNISDQRFQGTCDLFLCTVVEVLILVCFLVLKC